MERQSNLFYSIAHKRIDLNEIKKIRITNTESKCKFIELIWSCFLCAYVSFDHNALQNHLLDVHQVDRKDMCWRCIECGRIFNDYALFLNHLRIRHYNHLMKCCDICGKLQRSYLDLAKHRFIHYTSDISQSRPFVFQCFYCYEVFSNEDDLKNHIINYDGGEEHFAFDNPKRKNDLFICRFCSKSFLLTNDRTRHENCHIGNKPYTCHHCLSGFHCLKNLRAHENNIRSIQRHECKCGEIFDYTCQYKMHLNEHKDTSEILEYIKTEFFPKHCSYRI